MYHLEGLPPLCVLHGVDDPGIRQPAGELVPFNQSVMLDQELTRLGLPHEFYAYEGLEHCFPTGADTPQAPRRSGCSGIRWSACTGG
jgi:acetyl esterase/lipase